MADAVDESFKKIGVTVSKEVLAIICIVFGIIIIGFPQILAYAIGIFLIIQGILLAVDWWETKKQQTPHKTNNPNILFIFFH
jgi:uncharacterized membrane protein HdeD (DUF308 family)